MVSDSLIKRRDYLPSMQRMGLRMELEVWRSGWSRIRVTNFGFEEMRELWGWDVGWSTPMDSKVMLDESRMEKKDVSLCPNLKMNLKWKWATVSNCNNKRLKLQRRKNLYSKVDEWWSGGCGECRECRLHCLTWTLGVFIQKNSRERADLIEESSLGKAGGWEHIL